MTIANPAELAYLRKNTLAFIAANPLTPALVPRQKVKQGTGSIWVDLPARPAQRLRLIDQSSTGTPVPGTLQAADGQQRKVQFHLLGPHDAVFGIYDYWMLGGLRHEIAEIFPENGYEQRAQVVCYGH